MHLLPSKAISAGITAPEATIATMRYALRRIAVVLIAIVIGCLAGLTAAARPFVDGAGRTVVIPERVTRVLAAGPPASVLLYTLAPGRMVGWVRAPRPEEKPFLAPETHGLPGYGRLTGRGNTANVEAVLALKPDLIVDVGSTAPTFVSLADRVQEQTGIPYILLDGAFAKIPETYRKLGELIGEPGRAAELAAYAETTMAEIAKAVATVPEVDRPRVYYGRGPRGLETGLAGSLNTEILEIAGARNVAASGAAGGLAAVSPEQVLGWNPDVIITLDPSFRRAMAADPLWSGIKAVREGRVYQTPTLPFGWFDSPPGVNRLIGLRWLAGLFYPSLFKQPLGETTREFYRRFYHVELTPQQVEELLRDATGEAR
ncbi:iron ABC transporter substrate-binding protein [Methylobacterium sp.]|uniref:iron ABC transporter substrate-binding protein n=1 Tax=Methylobacterium sp. TaxID=409 RepID=UPI0025DEE11C|nr:iron ABC transporter substrate-binding protein [Methylobacterium sp.]